MRISNDINKPLLPASLTTGIFSVDKEHAEIIALSQRFRKLARSPINSAEFVEILSSIGMAILAHFKNEEELMKQLQMPEVEFHNHKIAHDKIIENYLALNEKIFETPAVKVETVLDSVDEWVIEHIKEYDMKINIYR